MDATASRALVQALARRLGGQLIETHISWVLLAGEFAYKVKKPLRLPFVDYSTPERRRAFCEEEVRLNRRLAPGLYLGVARITGSIDAPDIDGSGAALEHAVRMRRFPPGALLSEQAARGTLDAPLVDRLAQRLAAFHAEAPRCTPGPTDLRSRALAALQGARGLWPAPQQAQLARWIDEEAETVLPLWHARAAAGHVREGHGDLHLANLLTLDGEVMAFDAVEFDPSLRRIDVIEDIAFTVMDLSAQDLPGLAWRLLDGWLQHTGEYEGVPGLRLCLAYRALVRALACHLREPHGADAQRYARAALGWSAPAAPKLWITHGLPGSGKSWQSQRLLQDSGAVRIRSDVERKRLHGLAPLARSREQGLDLYTPEATGQTYARLLTLAGPLLAAGWPVVLDAAFLRRAERDEARALARTWDVPLEIVDCEAPLEVLRDRLRARVDDPSEADLSVLERLAAAREPLGDDERT
ncbi:bifunctional aminoglycoside phosphotransferase/ATP-binding protein [Ramlibacter sp. AN1133]|uniref:bifunctional aminoglycoside phosphotransferase/ATP-binding protein n=1 Tax=Ramlibacter sp. AN1133 TaxID=3133429 RepID=UPI0030BC7470